MMQVNTRGGVFSPDGYGGGVFNQNVAFGAIESNAMPQLGPAPMRHPLAGGTWGAIPWYCWGGASGLPENTTFKACIVGLQQRFGTNLNNPELIRAAQAECGGMCDELEASTAVYGGGYSADTANLQSRINAHIHASRAQDPSFPYCPVDVDGKIGPQTCTASKVLFGQWPDVCDAIGFGSSWQNEDCAGGHDVPPQPVAPQIAPPTTTPPPLPTTRKPKGFQSASLWVAGIIALGVGGVVAYHYLGGGGTTAESF